MQPLTCPIPGNINPLQSNGFIFDILKIPEVKFFCQEVGLPFVSFPSVDVPTPLSDIPLPNTKLQFGDLSISFLIDETMSNYVAIYNWLIGLGFPESHTQYQSFLNSRTNTLNLTPLVAGYSDAVLSILNSSSKPNKTVRFVDVFPISLGQVLFRSSTTDTTYLSCTASFKFNYYIFE